MRRLIVVLLATLAALAASAIVLAFAILAIPELRETGAVLIILAALAAIFTLASNTQSSGGDLIAFAALFAASILAAPLTAAILIDLMMKIRALAYYALVPGAIGAAVGWRWAPGIARTLAEHTAAAQQQDSLALALFTAGAAGGFIYWAIAGKATGLSGPR